MKAAQKTRQAIRALVICLMVVTFLSSLSGQSTPNQSNAVPANTQTFKDTHGNAVQPGTVCIAERKQSDGTVLVFKKNKQDIDKFISYLKQDGVKDKQLLTPRFWEASDCERRAGNNCSGGTCKSGSCQQTSSGSSTYCRCR